MKTTRFGIAQKLLAVCLAFGLPIVVMFVLMTKAKLTEIDFASKEIIGDEFQRPLEDVLQHLSRHRRLLTRSKAEHTGEQALRDEERAMSIALERLRAANRAYGSELQFTAEGLGLRKRSEFTSERLVQNWHAQLARLPAASERDAQRGYDALVAHVRTMITHAGDGSNLILDPDLDSYYLMDVTLLTLPQMEDRLQRIAASVEERAAAGRLNPGDRRRLSTLAAFLEEADWQRAALSMNTALNEDQNFHGTLPSLAPTLGPALEELGAATHRVVALLERFSERESTDGFDLAGFRGAVEELDRAVYRFHQKAFDQEDELLRARIRDFRRSLYWGFALAAGSLLVSSVLAFLLASGILRRVLRLSAATDALTRGEMNARVGAAGSDELGDLARSFDAMADRIGGLTAEVRKRADQLELVNGNLERNVEDRTRELTKRNDEFRLILDNAHDGMITVDLAGAMSRERSAILEQWLGAPRSGEALPEYLAQGNADFAATLRLGLEQVKDDILPVELSLDQLPTRMEAKGRHFRIAYQPIAEAGTVTHLLVVLSDVTSALEGRRAAALQQEALRIFQACQRDRSGFLDFFVDAREMVQKIAGAEQRSPGEIRRLIHTLKGNCALFGVLSISELCHDVETNMAENAGTILPGDVARLEKAWGDLSLGVRQTLGEDVAHRLEIADDEYSDIIDAIARGTPRRDILTAIARWKLEPVERRFARFAERARSMAYRLGKDLDVTLEPSDIRLCTETWSPVWSALVHVIRNAVDHGIEPSDERVRRGKPAAGQLVLQAGAKAGRVYIEIGDDGRGVEWDLVRVRAKAAGLPSETRRDLVEAILADGISTREVATDTSGRGVGMAAVREACASLDGSIEIDSEPGRGTTVRCTFPMSAMGGRGMEFVVSRPITRSLAPPPS